jgi:hypothetical protein
MLIPEENPQQDIGAGKRFARPKIRPASHFLEVPEQMPKFLSAFALARHDPDADFSSGVIEPI